MALKNHFRIAIFLLGAAAAAAQTPSPFQADTQPGQPTPPTQPAALSTPQNGGAQSRDTLTGDWNGLRGKLVDKGCTFSLVYEAEVFGNQGGARQGAISDGLFNLSLDLDLEKATGFWKGALFHTNAYYIYGPGLSARYVGDFSNTSNIAGYNTARLQELWLQQSLWQKSVSVRAGLLAADTEFIVSQASSLFINSTFGGPSLFSQNFTDAPIYPVANPAIRLDVAPVPAFDLKAALFGISASSDQDKNDRHGTYFDIDDGALGIVEGAFLLNQEPNAHGLVGSYKLGGLVHRGDYTTFHAQAENALGRGPLSGHGTNYAVYGIVDQEIYKSGDRIIEIFGRGGVAPGRYSFIDAYFDAGFNFIGFVPQRAADAAGIGIARSTVSREYSDARQLEGDSPSTAETVIEATYKVNITKWFTAQPDFQYVLNPSGVLGSRDALVLGLGTTITF